MTEEQREKIRQVRLKRPIRYWLGKTFSEEHRKKLSETAKKRGRRPPKGYWNSKGNIPWNKGKKGLQKAWNKGIPMKKASKEKLRNSINNLFLTNPAIRKKLSKAIKKRWEDLEYRRKCEEAQAGEKSYRWEGGKSRLPYSFDFSPKMKAFIRNRDQYKCQGCGIIERDYLEKIGENLSIHHINYDKNDASPRNLITTCRSCNSKANFNKKKWIKFFSTIIAVAETK